MNATLWWLVFYEISIAVEKTMVVRKWMIRSNTSKHIKLLVNLTHILCARLSVVTYFVFIRLSLLERTQKSYFCSHYKNKENANSSRLRRRKNWTEEVWTKKRGCVAATKTSLATYQTMFIVWAAEFQVFFSFNGLRAASIPSRTT